MLYSYFSIWYIPPFLETKRAIFGNKTYHLETKRATLETKRATLETKRAILVY